jgi:hypothetical protein
MMNTVGRYGCKRLAGQEAFTASSKASETGDEYHQVLTNVGLNTINS